MIYPYLLLTSILFFCTLEAADIFSDRSVWIRPDVSYPKDNEQTKQKVKLGKKLFFDPIISRAKNISCASCHDPAKGWSDMDKVAVGDKGAKGTRNSPGILNSAYQYTYFWDGRASSLEEQALGPISAKVEMNLDPREAVERLKNISEYRKLFKDAFGKVEITKELLAKAIASFERTIVSGDSRFDKWIAGDKSQMSKDEEEGFRIFLEKGNCSICHEGFNFSDQSFNNVGIDNGDLGRGSLKKRDFWQGTFKVPTLRNVTRTDPYFHDGSVEKLEDAVGFCAQGGRDKKAKNISGLLVDKKLSKDEIKKITSFLGTLSEPTPEF